MACLEKSLDSSEWMMVSKSEESGAEKIPILQSSENLPSCIKSKQIDGERKNDVEPDCDDAESIEKLSHESLEIATNRVFQGYDMDVKNCVLASMDSFSLPCDESDSSDVDVLDEIEEEDVNKQAEKFQHFSVVRKKNSVGVMTQDLLCAESTKCSGLMNHLAELTKELENHLSRLRWDQLAYGILFFVISLVISMYGHHLFCSYKMCKPENLAAVEEKILECLGRQYVNNMGCSRQVLDFSEYEGVLCLDEDNHYTDLIMNSLMDRGTLHFLSEVHAQMEKGEELMQVKWQQHDINLSLILRHLEFKNIFPRIVYGFSSEKLKEIERKQRINGAFREVLDEGEEIKKPIEDVVKHLPLNSKEIFYERLKNELIKHVFSEKNSKSVGRESTARVSNEESAEFNSYTNSVREAKDKIREWLKNKSQIIMGLSSSIFGPTGIKKIEENLDKVKTLPGVFEDFQGAVSDAVSNMQNVNNIIKNVLGKLDNIDDMNVDMADDPNVEADGSDWSWENFMKTTEETLNGWRGKIEREQERIHKVGFYESLKFYLKREREAAAKVLNTVKGYFTTSKKNTDMDGIVTCRLHRTSAEDDSATEDDCTTEDLALDEPEWGMWPAFLKPLISSNKPKNYRKKTDDASSDSSIKTSTGPSDTARGGQNSKITYGVDSKDDDNDWMFKRATGRKEIRETPEDSEINWYLKRKRSN